MFRIKNALIVPALVSGVFAVAEVQSVSVQPTDIPSGGSATGTVRVNGLTFGGKEAAKVTLTSSTGSVTVPALVVVEALGVKTFPLTTRAGFAGCPTISAQVGTTAPRSTMIFVKAPPAPGSSPLTLRVSSDQILGVAGPGTTGTVGLVQASPNGLVQLSSTSPIVSVPATVTVPLALSEMGTYGGSVTFPITVTTTVNTPTCSVIVANAAGSQVRVLVKVIPFLNG